MNETWPKWMWVVVGIEVVVPTFFGVATIADPSIWGQEALDVFGRLYVTRNLTMAFGVAFAALVLQSRTALLGTIAARYVTDFVDIAVGFAQGPESAVAIQLGVFTVVLLVIPAFGLRWLWRAMRGSDRDSAHLPEGRGRPL
ncbi:MAG: hypothetical protein AAF211_28145 [Myxococcota bacterium]